MDPTSATDLWSQLQPVASDDPQRRARIAGCQLGHFRVEEQIGRGGMGAVFRAVDLRLDRVVALKVLSPMQSKDHSSIERFRNEARAAARMDHDNIARVYYVGEDRGLSFIAFEFVHGATVRELIEQRRVLHPADAVNYALQIASALRHTDAAGVVHRDIKPSNIIITPGGRAKLVDLGLARKRDVQAGSDLTVDGTTLGTFDYISPEQAKDPRNVDVRSDIYSLGCTLYHMLTGQPPYPVGTMLQKLLDHQGKDIPDAAAANPRVPPELSAVVRKMMASDPRDRYASPDELIEDLSLMAHRFGLRPRPADGMPWAEPPARGGWDLWRQYGGWMATAAFLLMAVFVIDRAPRAPSSELASVDIPPQLVGRAGGETSEYSDTLLPTEESRTTMPRNIATMDPRGFDVDQARATTPGDPLAGLEIGGLVSERETSAIGSALPPVDEIFNNSPTSPGLIPQPIIPSVAISPGAGSVSPGGFPLSDPLPSDPEPNGGSVPVQPAETSAKENPFVVFVNSVLHKAYPTLEAAVADAPDNALIELQFDGDQQPLQPPLSILGKHLRIRAAKDYRPLLRFALPPGRRVPGREEQVSMLSVSGGSLGIYNVDLQLTVDPNLNIGQWVLLSLSAVEHLELHGVSMSLENNSPRSAALIDLAERLRTVFLDETVPAVRIESENCFFRGEGDLIVTRNVDPARIQFRTERWCGSKAQTPTWDQPT
jgi:serine/threonine-protein kinase